MQQARLAWPLRVLALALLSAGCLPSISDLNSGPLNSTFAVSDYFSPSGYMGDGEVFGSLVGATNSGCMQNQSMHRGNCYVFTYYPNAQDTDPWAGVFWVFPSNSWGSTIGRNIDVTKFQQISFWGAVTGPTPYTVGGSAVPFVGQAGGINPSGRYVTDAGGVDFVDGVYVNSAWSVGDPMNGITSTMQQFHIPFGPFDKGKGCQDPDPAALAMNGKANNCIGSEADFMAGKSVAQFLIGAFAWALHYPTDAAQCKPDSAVPDCHAPGHSSHFLNPAPVHIYLDDIVWDTEPPPP
jgi:hypothetical protein